MKKKSYKTPQKKKKGKKKKKLKKEKKKLKNSQKYTYPTQQNQIFSLHQTQAYNKAF